MANSNMGTNLIAWSEKFRCGVKALDGEHQALFGLLNTIHALASAEDGKSQAKEKFAQYLSLMKKHFRTEESLLKQNNYPGYPKQKNDHDALFVKYRGIEEKINSGELELTADLLKDVAALLTTHILEVDKAYGEFLGSVGVR